MPWAPDVRNKDSHPNMEILHLKGTDDFQEGINRLNKIREDEAFEKTLPGLQSLCELELRKALIKKRETLNWKQRDQQLENHFLKNWESFVDRLISKEAARDAKIQRRTMDRYKTLQSKEIPKEKRIGPVHDLQTQRWLEPPPSKKFSHIDGFVDIHSSFYCPMKRNGRFLRFLPPFPVFNDNFDASLFEKKISKFWDRCLPTKKETRGERQILRDLDKIWNEIQRDKQEGREYSESWICPGFHPLQAPTHRLSPSKTSGHLTERLESYVKFRNGSHSNKSFGGGLWRW